LTTWPEQGPPWLWETKAGEGYSALAVSGGRAFLLVQDGDHEAIVCWDSHKGTELWRFRYPASYKNEFGNGPRSTPCVEGGHVYTVGATGIMHCLKAAPADAAGEKVWRKNLLEEFGAANIQWGVSFSPLIEGDLIFVMPGGAGGNSLAALDKRTGEVRWKALDDPAAYSSPVAATIGGQRQVIFFTRRGLVGVTPEEGQLLWRYPWETDYGANIATPIVAKDYVFITTGYNRGCAVVKIERQADGSFAAQRVYEHNKMSSHFSTPVFYQDYIYGFHDSNLICLEFRTGKVMWKERGFSRGSLLVADGHLFILGQNGRLGVAQATPDGYRPKGLVQVFPEEPGKKCWTVPVLANGRLYVRDEDRVICLDVRKD
jgi:outer membrane protein assembly factor BamB